MFFRIILSVTVFAGFVLCAATLGSLRLGEAIVGLLIGLVGLFVLTATMTEQKRI